MNRSEILNFCKQITCFEPGTGRPWSSVQFRRHNRIHTGSSANAAYEWGVLRSSLRWRTHVLVQHNLWDCLHF